MHIEEIELGAGRRLKLRIASAGCTHLDQIHGVSGRTSGCEECLALGDAWVHLRLCLFCGHVGCCDNSKNRHATKHHHETDHAIIQSYEPGEAWMYCYPDDVFMEPIDEQPASAR